MSIFTFRLLEAMSPILVQEKCVYTEEQQQCKIEFGATLHTIQRKYTNIRFFLKKAEIGAKKSSAGRNRGFVLYSAVVTKINWILFHCNVNKYI